MVSDKAEYMENLRGMHPEASEEDLEKMYADAQERAAATAETQEEEGVAEEPLAEKGEE